MGTLFAKQERRVVLVGLDAAGKTTLVYRLTMDRIKTTTPLPTLCGFGVETVEYKGMTINVWDVGCDFKFFSFI